MPSPSIAIYGALARFNYGDLLFPIVLKRALETAGCDRPIEAVGLRESDLSRFGALPTRRVGWLADPGNLPDGSKVIIAGGEALAAGWGRLYSHLLPQRVGDPIYSLMSRCLSEQSLDQHGQRRAKVAWPIPFCPEPRHFENHVDVIFNAVGGSGLPARSAAWREGVGDAIKASRYASVRDRATFEALGGSSAGCEVRPDSAAVIGEMFPRPWLREHCRADVRPIITSGRPFLCFQLHRYFTPQKLQKFAGQLDRLQEKEGIRPVLLPIGRAAGHSDQVALAKVRAAMSTPAEMPKDLGIFDVMALLAHCTAYAGTSLHGLITAMTYGRPYAVLGKNPKCLAFADAWAPPEFRPSLKAKSFATDIAQRIGGDSEVLASSSKSLTQAAREGLCQVVAAALVNDAPGVPRRVTRTSAQGAGEPRRASPEFLAS